MALVSAGLFSVSSISALVHPRLTDCLAFFVLRNCHFTVLLASGESCGARMTIPLSLHLEVIRHPQRLHARFQRSVELRGVYDHGLAVFALFGACFHLVINSGVAQYGFEALCAAQ